MKRAIDNGQLKTDLDANHLSIRNLTAFTPPPPDLVLTDDPRLSDRRDILDGTVTDDSVADDAGIVQAKLNLNGDLPLNYLGTDGAARGDLCQPLAEKGALNGYAALGLDSKLPSGSTPVSGTGTLHTIDIEFPVGEVNTLPNLTGTVQTFTGYWAAQAGETFFGNFSGAIASPTFEERVFPVALIPGFDASRITSGTFTVDQIPVAIGVGAGHASGLTPHPGSTDTDSTAQPTDYLGRDMLYHPMKPVVSSQPTLPSPSITVQSYFKASAYINITLNNPGGTSTGANIFYAVGSSLFKEVFPGTLPLTVTIGTVVQAYAAQAGFNNSQIVSYTVPPSPTK
jgi:hypothetical protein